ncbi:phosphate ABC transporter permease PstA [Jatrophihabitans sp. YIM 134969]
MTTTENRSTAASSTPRHEFVVEDRDVTEVLPAVDIDATTAVPSVGRSATTLPARGAGAVGPRRRTGGRPPGDVQNMAFAGLAGLCVAILLFGVIGPLSGKLGFAVVAWVGFVVTYAVLVAVDNTGAMVRDRVMTVVLGSLGTLLFGALLTVVFFVLGRGLTAMVHVNFWTEDQSATGPLDGLEVGGILHAIVGSLVMMAICLVITVPVGIACAVFLAVVKGPGSRFVRTIVEAMTALPSIVAGLFVLATWILAFGFQRSGLAASLALSVMMLPIIIRAADVVLRLVPGTLLEASEALGAPRWRTVWHVVLPTSKSGLATAVILGTARGIGETSPVLLTAGFTQSLNWNPLSGPMVSLPLAAYTFTRSPQPDLVARGFGTAAALMILVAVLFFIARLIGGRGAGVQSPRQRRRAVRQSLNDAQRFSTVSDSSGPDSVGHVPTDSMSRPIAESS